MAKGYAFEQEFTVEAQPTMAEVEKQAAVDNTRALAHTAHRMAALCAASGNDDIRGLADLYHEIGMVWETHAIRIRDAKFGPSLKTRAPND